MVSSSPFTHFSGQSALLTGAVTDFGQGIDSFTVQISTNGSVTAGAATILGSVDGVTFSPIVNAVQIGKAGTSGTIASGVVTFTGTGSVLISDAAAGNAIRFLRVDITTAVVGGTLTALSIGQA